ncbi:MAG: dihydrolipoyl dehydrogenase [Egibacteraceae bacterium]
MVVGQVPEGVDLLVVGAGPGGYTAALRAAQLGREVTLVDRDGSAGVGGVCLRTGCIPSKALIEVADTAHRARSWSRAGLRAEGLAVDLGAFQRFKSEAVTRLGDAVRRQLDAAGVRVLPGRACFTRPAQAAIERDDGPSRFVEFRDVILATGSRPMELRELPHDEERVLDSTDALCLHALPASVAVVGGGFIGVELGTALAKLGAHVTIVEALDRLLPALDAAVAPPVQRRLAALGVDVLVSAQARDFDGRRLKVETTGGSVLVEADALVVAVGRRPNSDGLGLERLGVRPRPDGLLEVGPDRLAGPHIAAIGDLTPGPALAHKATAEAEVAAEALCGRPAAFDPAAVPAVVFSDPEVAVAGLSVAHARAAGMTTRVATVPLAASARAVTLGLDKAEGFVRLVIDADADAVVGAQIVGPHACELIAEAVLAIEMAASPTDLAGTIHPHPTLSELLAQAARVT